MERNCTLKGTLCFILTLVILILQEQPMTKVRAVPQPGQPLVEIAEVLESDLQLTEADYAYLLLEEAIPNGSDWEDTGDSYRFNISDASLKGEIAVTFSQVNSYNHQYYDLKITVTDWKETDSSQRYIELSKSSSDYQCRGFEWIEITWEFLDSHHQVPVRRDVILCVDDLQNGQYIEFDSESTRAKDKLYVTGSDHKLLYTLTDEKLKVYSDTDDTQSFLATFQNTDRICFRSGREQTELGSDEEWGVRFPERGYEFLLIPPPVETLRGMYAQDVTELELVDINEEFFINVTHDIPDISGYNIWSYLGHYFYNFDYRKNLIGAPSSEIFEVLDVQVFDTEGNNITEKAAFFQITGYPFPYDVYSHFTGSGSGIVPYHYQLKVRVSDYTQEHEMDQYWNPETQAYEFPHLSSTTFEHLYLTSGVKIQHTNEVMVRYSKINVNYEWLSDDGQYPDDVKEPNPDTIWRGEPYTAKEQEPTSQDYRFHGWYTDEGLTEKYVDGTPLRDSMTLYGQWERTMVNVDYEWVTEAPDDIPPPARETILCGTAYATAKVDVPKNWKFSGWHWDAELTKPYANGWIPQEDITLYGGWMEDPASYLLTVNYWLEQIGTVSVFDSVVTELLYQETYSIATPKLEGHQADQEVVEGAMPEFDVEHHVVYTKIDDAREDNQDPDEDDDTPGREDVEDTDDEDGDTPGEDEEEPDNDTDDDDNQDPDEDDESSVDDDMHRTEDGQAVATFDILWLYAIPMVLGSGIGCILIRKKHKQKTSRETHW